MSSFGVAFHFGRKLSIALFLSLMIVPASSFADDDNGTGSCALNTDMQDLPDQAQSPAGDLASETGGSGVKSAVEKWKKAHDSCKDDNKDAQKECFEACSKDAQGGLSGANALGGQMNIMQGNINTTGNQQNQAAQTMNNGYSGYLAKCKTTQSACTKSCGNALSEAKSVASAAKGVTCDKEETKSKCQQAKSKIADLTKKEAGSDKDVAQGKNDQCSKDFTQRQSNAQQLMDALKNIMQALAQAMQNQSDAGDSSTSSTTSSTTLTCSELQAAGNTAAMQSRTDCICGDGTFAGLDPRRAGCPMAGQASDGSTNASGFGPSATEAASATTPSGATGNSETPSALSQQGGGGGGLGGGGYGGGGGGAGGTSPNGTKANVEAGQKAGLKADILAGDSGGGGGGGGGWSFGGSDKPEAAGKGAGARGLAAISAARAAAGVSGSAGRSNWEKIRDRYKDNRPTFVKD